MRITSICEVRILRQWGTQEMRLAAELTAMARPQVWTMRERLLKLGVRVVASVCPIVLHLPESFPFLGVFRQVARALGATAG